MSRCPVYGCTGDGCDDDEGVGEVCDDDDDEGVRAMMKVRRCR